MQLDKIPEVQKAIAKAAAEADAWRDYAFTDLPERIGRLDVAQLTVRHLFLLFAVKSPFLCGGPRLPEDVTQFLWIIRKTDADRSRFIARVARMDYPRTLRAIDRYLQRALLDAPGGKGDGGPTIASFPAVIVHRLATAYGWAREGILALAASEAFQYLRLIDRQPDRPMLHPRVDRAQRLAWQRWKKKHPKQWAAHQAQVIAERKTRKAARRAAKRGGLN